MGRIKVSIELLEKIIDEIFENSTLDKALKKHGVGQQSFYGALDRHPEMSSLYERAIVARGHSLFNEIVGIADDETKNPNHARNQIDARKFVVARMVPNKYGDRLDVSITNTVDIGSALAEAHARLRPICDPDVIEYKQPIGIIDVSSVSETGYKPDDADDAASISVVSDDDEDILG